MKIIDLLPSAVDALFFRFCCNVTLRKKKFIQDNNNNKTYMRIYIKVACFTLISEKERKWGDATIFL